MRRWPLVFFAFLMMGMAGDHALSAQNPNDNCGPRYRRDPAATNRVREAKKAQMRQRGFPERFLSLLDREECVACVENASDSFGIKVVYNDDDNAPTDANGRRWTSHTFGWDPQSERQVRDELAAGKIKAFYIMNTATRCQCCPDVNDDSKTNASYPDWNPELEVHMSHVIAFDDPGDLGPLPPDLENPPDGWINDVPNVQQFRKPPHRQVHVLCKECTGLADKANSAYDTLNYLWDRKLALLKGISITENAMGHRANEIARLEYQQLFSTASAARQKEIDSLTDVNKDQQEGVERDGRRLEEIEVEIAEQTRRIADLIKLIIDCENRCKTATTANAGTAVTDSRPEPSVAPTSQPPAACPDCAALAEQLARLNSDRQTATAERDRTQAAIDVSMISGDRLATDRAIVNRPGEQNVAARLQEIEARAAELREFQDRLRGERASHQQRIDRLTAEIATARAALDDCNRKCATTGAGDTGGVAVAGGTGTRPADRTVTVDPITPIAACKECEPLANQLRTAHRALQDLARRANDLQRQSDFDAFEEQRAKLAQLAEALAACNKKCKTTASASEPPPAACFGSDCADQWQSCAESGTCTPVESDCGVPGTCSPPPCGVGETCIDLTSPLPWGCDGCDADPAFQVKQVDILDPFDFQQFSSEMYRERLNVTPGIPTWSKPPAAGVWIPPVPRQEVRSWFNPLGLLARTLTQAVDRWRGSIGPAPLISPRDLAAIAPYSSGQASGLPAGVHLLLSDAGGSTGKTLTLQVLNLSGKPARLSSMPFAVEPIRQQAQQRVQQAFSRLAKAAPVRLELSAYCVELLKAPPRPGTILRLAPPAVQQKFAPMNRVLQAAYRVEHAGLLRPDSNPAAYTDSIKQWAVWAVEQRFNQSRYTDAFVAHTKKNVEAAGQQWTRQAEDVIRKVSPNRWQDIVKVLTGAGIPPSQ